MTEKERFDLCMSTKLGDILSEEFKTYLLANGFFSAPASTKYHGAYEGGLFDHSFAVMNFLVELSAKNGLKWQRAESPFIVGMFHDLCKIDQYRIDNSVPYIVGDSTKLLKIKYVPSMTRASGNTTPTLSSRVMAISRLSSSLSTSY